MCIRYEILSRVGGEYDIFAYNDRTGEMAHLATKHSKTEAEEWLNQHTGTLLPDYFNKGE